MNSHRFPVAAILVLALSAACVTAQAQEAAYNLSDTQASAPSAAPSYSQAQLDQMLAPIALYPDPLIGHVLMAATYPLEIVEAARWLQNASNASLTGDPLVNALAQQPWDPSVKALVAVPPVLNMMNTNLQWTEQLGDAFLAQQGDVMNSIQGLRQRAQATGALSSNAEEMVATQGADIAIEPDNPDVVYVPVYNPDVVYGSWPYPAYQPYYFYPPGYVWGAGLIGFGVGIVVANSLWSWDHWDWQHHRIDINDARFSALNNGRPPLVAGQWQHNPDHRHGVPYRDAATRARFLGAASITSQRRFRGYSNTVNPTHATDLNRTSSVTRSNNESVATVNRITSQPQVRMASPPQTHYAVPAVQQRPITPMFESFSRGPDVRAQSMRGAQSRAAAPALNTFHASASAPIRASSGGNRGNESNNRR